MGRAPPRRLTGVKMCWRKGAGRGAVAQRMLMGDSHSQLAMAAGARRPLANGRAPARRGAGRRRRSRYLYTLGWGGVAPAFRSRSRPLS